MTDDNLVETARVSARVITDLPPCALQFHPVDTTLLLLGTYKLEETSKSRHGSLDFYRFLDNSEL